MKTTLAESPHSALDALETAGGGRAVTALLARAFRDNPMNCAVLRRSPAARVRSNQLGARLLLRHARGAGHLLTEWSHATTGAAGHESATRAPSPQPPKQGSAPIGALVGFGPSRPAPGLPGLVELLLLLRQGVGVTSRWAEVQSALRRIRPVSSHWTLAIVGVEPADQGRGIGARLVGRWLERVDASGHPAWVEIDRPELLSFYRRFGFEPTATCSVHGVQVIGLSRPGAPTR